MSLMSASQPTQRFRSSVLGIAGNRGLLGNSVTDFVRSCCDRNRDLIQKLEQRVNYVDNDMGSKFKDNFKRIDDVLDGFEARLDELEIKRDAQERDVDKLDDKNIALSDKTTAIFNSMMSLSDNILELILVGFLNSGITVGRFNIDQDVNGDLRVTD